MVRNENKYDSRIGGIKRRVGGSIDANVNSAIYLYVGRQVKEQIALWLTCQPSSRESKVRLPPNILLITI